MLSIQEARESRKEKNGNFKGKEGFPGGSSDKESACNAGAAGATGSVPGSGRSPGGGNGNPLQYSCLEENPTDRGAYSACGYKESDMTEVN